MSLIEDAALISPDVLKRELAADVLRTYGRLRLGVTGWSMIPTIWPGDTLVIERADREDVMMGDVVLFRRDQRLYVHRVFAKTQEEAILTRGDGMPRLDEPVKSSELMGRISSISRRGKSLEPKRSLNFFERIVAGLVRRFAWPIRLLAHLHVMRQQQEHTVACQN
jgi:signal peptidase I